MNDAIPSNRSIQISCDNEYDTLKQVIVVPPAFMRIEEAINETQEHYLEEDGEAMDASIAQQQHREWIQTLTSRGIEVISLEAKQALPEQVFTRDIGFTIGNKLFISNLKEETRQSEEQVLINWLKQLQIPYHRLSNGTIEGGDVIVDGKTIWVGLSSRTSKEAVVLLAQQLPDYDIYPIPLRDDILHLDCVFNLISANTALIHPPAIDPTACQRLQETYTCIEVTDDEQFHMGPNVLSIGNQTIISLPENERLNTALRAHQYEVIEVPFSEIIKSGGSYRCCTLPLWREK